MNGKRVLSILLILACLLSAMAGVAVAVPARETAETRAARLTTDEAFFKALNLNASGLSKVKTAVSAGNYTLAKTELLSYYKNKFAGYHPSPATELIGSVAQAALQDTFSFSEPLQSSVSVAYSDSYTEYTFAMTKDISGCYVLSALDKTANQVRICSSEHSSESVRPKLLCYDSSKNLIATLSASHDTYVDYGKPDTSYGTATYLYAKDHSSKDSSGRYLPYGSKSRRTYMKFDAAQIPSATKYTQLVIHARTEGSDTGSALSLYQFVSYWKTWTEDVLTWNYLVNNDGIGHYSWKGISGGFDWKEPEGVSNQWFAYNSRFLQMSSLLQMGISNNRADCIAKAEELLMDFVSNVKMTADWEYAGGIQSGNRLMEFPYIYKSLLTYGDLTAEENMQILAWLYDEMVYMDEGGGLFNNSDATAHSDLVYTNQGFWLLVGFYGGFGYWPEFSSASSWKSRYVSRENLVLNTLIHEDGSFNEVTFGYPCDVLNWYWQLRRCMVELGDVTSSIEKMDKKFILLCNYLMHCAQSNQTSPNWGQGGKKNIATAIRTLLDTIGSKYPSDRIVQELRYFVDHQTGMEPSLTAQFDGIKVVTDRSGWERDDTMIFMNAKCAGNHSHRDALALLLYHDGRELLTDTGMTSYSNKHPHYDWQNSITRSHNTIEIDGISQVLYQNLSDVTNRGDIDIVSNESAASISAWTTANTNDTHTKSLSMDGVVNNKVYHKTDFTHYRNVTFLKELGDILIVTDKVVPQDSASHSYTQNWHSAPFSSPKIASDSYKTGRTSFSDGSNLLIAQSGYTGTAAVRSGYDATVPSVATSYFEYKQSKAGTVTYHTVLYPISEGVTATVAPTKLSMSGTDDATALATKVSISDSGNGQLKTLYHYNSFEGTPSSRSFGGYTTNASVAALNLNASGKASFAYLANGSSLCANSGTALILTTSRTVSDLSASLQGSTLRLFSSDENLDRICIKVNMGNASITQVELNGHAVDFSVDSAKTVTVGQRSVLLSFNGTGPAATAASWIGTRTSFSIDKAAGVMKGSTTGGDPSVVMDENTDLAYVFQEGDVVEVRIKAAFTAGSADGFQIFFSTEENPGLAEKRSVMKGDYRPNGAYQILTMDASARGSVVGQTLDWIRVDVIGGAKTSTARVDFEIDYIYIGPKDQAPSRQAGGLYFGFDNSAASKARYAGAAYGDRNFDTGFWNHNIARNTKPFFDEKAGTMSFFLTAASPYLQTSDHTGRSLALVHSYVPSSTDVLQMRVKFEDCAVVSGSPSLRLYYIKNNSTAGVGNSDYFAVNIPSDALSTEKYITLSCNASDAFKAASVINALRMTFNNVGSAQGKTGKITVDYLYVGPSAHAPVIENDTRLFFDFTNTAADRNRYRNDVYGGWNYDAGNWVGSAKRNTTPVFDSAAGTLSYNLVNGATGSYLQPCDDSYGNLTGPLSYCPNTGDMVQIRFKLTNFTTVSGATPYFEFYYLTDNSGSGIQTGDRVRIKLSAAAVKSGKYMTLTLALPEGFTEAAAIFTIRPCFSGITNVSGKTATVTIDYIAVGQKESLPKKPYLVTFADAAGATLETRYAVNGDEVSFSGTAPTKAAESSGHYVLGGWANASGTKLDMSKITADIKVYPYFTKTAHSYKYTNNTSNHTAKCSVCSYSTNQNHVWSSSTLNQPDCTVAGTRTYKCACGATKTETVAAKAHTLVTIPAVAATCEKTGLTAGKKCSACGKVTVAQQTVAKTAHDLEVVPAVAATCTKTGLTEGRMCSDCGTVTVAQKTVAKTGHKAVTDPAVAATCTKTGLTAGSHCSVCKVVITAQKTTAKLAHNYSKYTNTSAAKHTIKCSRCTATTTAAHKYSNYKCVCGDMTSPKLMFNFNNLSTDQSRYHSVLYGKTNFDTTAAWGAGGGRVSKISIDTKGGTIAMQIASGKDSPYIQTTTKGGDLCSTPLSYYPRSGDVVQLRFKMTNCKAVAGAKPDLRIYFIKNNATTGIKNSDFSRVVLNTNAAFCGDWIVMTVPMTGNFVDASVINSLRISFNGVEAVAGKTGSITIQYISVGQRTSMPNDYRLYMNFTNTSGDQNRYKTALYGTNNYDTGFWGYNPGRSTKPVFNSANGGTMSFHIASGGNQPYIQMTDSTGSLVARPMKYNPEAGDTLKIRFKLTNCKAMSGVTPALRLYYIKNYATGGVVGSDYTAQNLNVKTAFSGNYVTVTMPLNSSFTTAKYINALRISFTGIEAVAGKTGTVTIDYIAIGQSNELP